MYSLDISAIENCKNISISNEVIEYIEKLKKMTNGGKCWSPDIINRIGDVEKISPSLNMQLLRALLKVQLQYYKLGKLDPLDLEELITDFTYSSALAIGDGNIALSVAGFSADPFVKDGRLAAISIIERYV
jgi:hypothetical protein